MKERVGEILNLLEKIYPEPKLALSFNNPLELLIATILAAQCTDLKVNQISSRLFKKYKSVKDYAMVDIKDLENDIKEITFYKNKAAYIIKGAKKIIEEFGGKVPQDISKLITLPGVGRKTANILIGNAFKGQAIAVDTHVLRVSNRLGLATSSDPDKVEENLTRQIPQEKWTTFTLAMILFGRKVCTAKNPKCGTCVLYGVCRWEGKKISGKKIGK
ncbi:MAG: endonuclease III [Nitrospirota bacterium]